MAGVGSRGVQIEPSSTGDADVGEGGKAFRASQGTVGCFGQLGLTWIGRESGDWTDIGTDLPAGDIHWICGVALVTGEFGAGDHGR